MKQPASSIVCPIFIPSKNIFPAAPLLILIALFLLVTGCSYYKVKTANIPALAEQLKSTNRYFVIHYGSSAWHLNKIILNNEKEEIAGVRDSLPVQHQYYKTTKPNKLNRYNPKQGDPHYEIHLYIAQYTEQENSGVTIPFSSISKIEIYDKAKGVTVISHVAPYVVGGVVVTLVVAMIVLIIMYVYILVSIPI